MNIAAVKKMECRRSALPSCQHEIHCLPVHMGAGAAVTAPAGPYAQDNRMRNEDN